MTESGGTGPEGRRVFKRDANGQLEGQLALPVALAFHSERTTDATLTPLQRRILKALEVHPRSAMDLAIELDQGPPTVSGALTNLWRGGFVTVHDGRRFGFDRPFRRT